MGGFRGVAGAVLSNREIDSVPLGVYQCIMQARRTTRARAQRESLEVGRDIFTRVCVRVRMCVGVTELGSVCCSNHATPGHE